MGKNMNTFVAMKENKETPLYAQKKTVVLEWGKLYICEKNNGITKGNYIQEDAKRYYILEIPATIQFLPSIQRPKDLKRTQPVADMEVKLDLSIWREKTEIQGVQEQNAEENAWV
jgi:hypothetical protein